MDWIGSTLVRPRRSCQTEKTHPQGGIEHPGLDEQSEYLLDLGGARSYDEDFPNTPPSLPATIVISHAGDQQRDGARTYHALYATSSVTKRLVLRDRTQAAIPTEGRAGAKLPSKLGG